MSEPQHAVGLVPFQLVLDVDGGLSLDNETDQRYAEEEGSVVVFPTGQIFRIGIVGRCTVHGLHAPTGVVAVEGGLHASEIIGGCSPCPVLGFVVLVAQQRRM